MTRAEIERIKQIVAESHTAGPETIGARIDSEFGAKPPTPFNVKCARAILDHRKRVAGGMDREESWQQAFAEAAPFIEAEDKEARFAAMTKGSVGTVTAAIRWIQANESEGS
jgi:hypothetical protein